MRSEHLVKAIKDGRVEAFEELYASYFQKVYFFSLKICKSKEAAEEITHDTFVTIWKKRETLLEDMPLDGLLFKITKDASFKHLQKLARFYHLENNLKRLVNNVDDSTVNEIDYREKLKQIEHVIERLPPKRREIFERRIMEQQSIAMISENMGITANTTKTQLLKATQFVREQLRIIS